MRGGKRKSLNRQRWCRWDCAGRCFGNDAEDDEKLNPHIISSLWPLRFPKRSGRSIFQRAAPLRFYVPEPGVIIG